MGHSKIEVPGDYTAEETEALDRIRSGSPTTDLGEYIVREMRRASRRTDEMVQRALRGEVEAREAIIADLRQKLEQAQQKMGKLDEDVKLVAGLRERLEKDRAGGGELSDGDSLETIFLRCQIEDRDAAISQRDASIANLLSELRRKEEEFAAYQQGVVHGRKAMEHELAELRTKMGQVQVDRDHTRRERDEARAQADQMREALVDAQQKMGELTQLVAGRSEEVRRLEGQRDKLQANYQAAMSRIEVLRVELRLAEGHWKDAVEEVSRQRKLSESLQEALGCIESLREELRVAREQRGTASSKSSALDQGREARREVEQREVFAGQVRVQPATFDREERRWDDLMVGDDDGQVQLARHDGPDAGRAATAQIAHVAEWQVVGGRVQQKQDEPITITKQELTEAEVQALAALVQIETAEVHVIHDPSWNPSPAETALRAELKRRGVLP